MRILLLGGTRFVGRALAARLVAAGHEVTVCSRRAEGAPPGVRVWAGERAEVLAQAPGRPHAFDAVVDFTAYDGGAVARALAVFPQAAYLFISSTWLGRPTGPVALPPVTVDYLNGKRAAEDEVARARAGGRRAAVVRLPMVCGAGDHTGRVDFYRRRLRDGEPVILVEGGTNPVPLLWREDAAEVLNAGISGGRIWAVERSDALPEKAETVSVLLARLAAAEGVAYRPVAVAGARLRATFAAYLEAEPWWRETVPKPSPENLFSLVGLAAREPDAWIDEIVRGGPPRAETGDLRVREAAWWREHGAAVPS
ncbi:MAG: hypothetical protein NTU80_10385 [Verrucomicrobia bacterium]|nr:hypothetical protein [Verrucomicrobiota bacterium]